MLYNTKTHHSLMLDVGASCGAVRSRVKERTYIALSYMGVLILGQVIHTVQVLLVSVVITPRLSMLVKLALLKVSPYDYCTSEKAIPNAKPPSTLAIALPLSANPAAWGFSPEPNHLSTKN